MTRPKMRSLFSVASAIQSEDDAPLTNRERSLAKLDFFKTKWGKQWDKRWR